MKWEGQSQLINMLQTCQSDLDLVKVTEKGRREGSTQTCDLQMVYHATKPFSNSDILSWHVRMMVWEGGGKKEEGRWGGGKKEEGEGEGKEERGGGESRVQQRSVITIRENGEYTRELT